jgi:hypothetical protein
MNHQSHFDAVLCVANEGNEASLQLWKVYKTLSDGDAQSEGLLRVIDESGEDYLFPEENFAPIELPVEARKPFERAIRAQRRAAARPRVSPSTRTIRSRRAVSAGVEAKRRNSRR